MKKDVVLRWLKKADNDLIIVERLIGVQDIPTDVLCFHCQQAVEKYLKAYLTWKDVRVKKTHDLSSILNLCIEKEKDFETLDKNKISSLTIYAVEIRYPDEYLEPEMTEVREFFNTAKQVEKFVKQKLSIFLTLS